MAKLEIPKFRYLFQDDGGEVQVCTRKPLPADDEWRCGGEYSSVEYGARNPNWRDTLIDLDVDDYEFEDGILRRIENDTTKN